MRRVLVETVIEIIIGAGMVLGGIFGKKLEWYPGRAGKQRGLPPYDPWIGRIILIGFGMGLFLDGISKLFHNWNSK